MSLPAPIHYAIVGTGGIAKVHAQSIAKDPRAKLLGVFDVLPEKARALAAEHNAPLVFDSLDALLASKDIHALDLCTPPRTHAGLIQSACHARKPVLCEKPVVLSLKELDDTQAIEKSTGNTVGCIFQWRYGRGVRMLRHLIDRKIAGRFLWANVQVAWFRNQAYYNVPWRGRWDNESGGVAVGQSIHAIDALLHITGRPKRITAHIRTLNHNIQIEDYAHALVEFEDNAVATVQCTVDCLHERSQLMFGFQHLTAISNDTPYSTADFPWTFQASDRPSSDLLKLGAAANEEQQRMLETQKQVDSVRAQFEAHPSRADHASIIHDFTTALLEGRKPAIGLEDCRPSAEFLSALYKSAHNHGTPVELPISKADPHYPTWNGIA